MRLLQIFPATNALDYFPKNFSSHRAFSGLSNAVTETSASTGVLRQYVFNVNFEFNYFNLSRPCVCKPNKKDEISSDICVFWG